MIFLTSWLSPILGGHSTAFQGEAGQPGSQARLGDVPQGCPPPTEAAHRPDPTTGVPGRIDARGWKGKSWSRLWARVPRVCCVLPEAAGQSAQAGVSAQSPGHPGTHPRNRHPEVLARPFLGMGWLWEAGVQKSTRTDFPFLPRTPFLPGSRVTRLHQVLG